MQISRTRRRWLNVRGLAPTATLVVLACLFGLFASSAGARPTLAPTRLVHFQVFNSGGKIVGVSVTATLSGSCFTGSIGLPRPDAWRCTVGNALLDPCLQPPRGTATSLVCVEGTKAVRLRLTKALPKSSANGPETTFFPWRLVLANGDVCERFTGTAAGSVQGSGLVYGCSSGGTTTEPSRSHATWTVRYLRKGVDPSTVRRLSSLKLLTVLRALG